MKVVSVLWNVFISISSNSPLHQLTSPPPREGHLQAILGCTTWVIHRGEFGLSSGCNSRMSSWKLLLGKVIYFIYFCQLIFFHSTHQRQLEVMSSCGMNFHSSPKLASKVLVFKCTCHELKFFPIYPPHSWQGECVAPPTR